MGIAGLALSESEGQIFLRGQPMPGREPVDVAAIEAMLDAAGFTDCARDAQAIAQAAQDANTRDTPFALVVAQRCDARLEIEITEDAMQASVTLTPAQGGRALGIQEVISALIDAGVNMGLDHDTLLEACNAGSAHKLVVASGAPPQEGRDSNFAELTEETSDRAPRVNADGLIDYRERSGLTLVEAGALLMRRTPAIPGIPGHNVRGEPLPPPPVRDEPFASDLSGAQASADDPDLLVATMAGAPVRVPAGVIVEPVLRVAEVNLATGNIYFDGTVQVAGDVIQNMKVQATGDIFVGGTVEAGTLDAGGNIHVKGGVIAASRVQAGAGISARFAEASVLEAATVLAIDDSALDCTLTAHNQILIGTKNTQRGRLMGGSATAKLLLRVPVLGSDKSGVTKVVVGFDAALEARYQALEQRIAQEKANEDNLHKLCNHLVAIKDPKGMLERAKTSWRQAAQVWGKSLMERTELEKERAVILGARLEIAVQAAGQIDLTFGTKRLALRKEYGKGYFNLDREGRMVFTTPDGKAAPAS